MGELAASVYEYTIGRFLALSAEGVGPPASPYTLPPLLSAEANRTHLLDMLCMCRQFKTPTSHMAAQLNATQCESVQFADRWVISTDISHVKSTHVHVQGSEIVLGGLHVLVFHSKTSSPSSSTVIAFRHQEGESLLDNDMWEAMALYGRNFVQMEAGPSPLTLLDYTTRAIQALLFGARHAVEMDYFTLAKALVGELVPGGDSVTFTGYSMGGALAQLMAIESNSKAVVFASNGVLDVLSQYHVNPAVVANLPTSHLVNIMHPQDDVPKLDCQIGTLFLHNDVSHDHLHESFVYGDLAWNQLVHTPYSSHVEHGRVWSQTHGICIDNDLNDPMAFAVDSVAQSSSSQALATLVGGGLVLVAIKMLARWRK